MQEPLEHVNIEAAGEGQHLPDLLGAGAALQMPMPPAVLSGHDELVEAPTFARRLRSTTVATVATAPATTGIAPLRLRLPLPLGLPLRMRLRLRGQQNSTDQDSYI